MENPGIPAPAGRDGDGALHAPEGDVTYGRPHAPAEPDPQSNKCLHGPIKGVFQES